MKHGLNPDEASRAKEAKLAKEFSPSLASHLSRGNFKKSVFHPCFIRG